MKKIFKISILFLLVLNCWNDSFGQEFSKSFDFGNSFTRFISSVRSRDLTRDGQIIVGITKEAPNSTFNDLLIMKIDLNGNINYAQVVDMPGSNENATHIINDNNPNNLNGFVILCSSTKFSNANEQDVMIITLSADLAFRPGLSFIYENNNNADKFDYPSNIFQRSDYSFLISGYTAPDVSQTGKRRPLIMAISNSNYDYVVQFRKRLQFSMSSSSTSILVDSYYGTDIIVGGSYIPVGQANFHPFISRFSLSGNYYYTNGYNANLVSEVHNGFDYIKQLSDGSFAAIGGGRTFTGQTPGNTIHNSIYMNIANGFAANQMTVLSAKAYSNSTNSTFPNRAFTLRESNGNIFIEGQCSTGSTNSINNIYLMKINKSGALNGFLQSFGKSIENETSSSGEHFSIIQDDASNIDLVGIGFSSNSSNTLGISYRIKKNIVADFVLDCKPTFGFNVSNITPTRVAVNPTIENQTITKTALNLFQKYICVASLDYCGYLNTKQAITTNEFEGLKIYPNPTSNKTTFEFTIENDNSKVYLEIFNVLGKKVERIIDGKKLSGNQIIEIDSSNLMNGIYLIKLSINGKVESKELIINK